MDAENAYAIIENEFSRFNFQGKKYDFSKNFNRSSFFGIFYHWKFQKRTEMHVI